MSTIGLLDGLSGERLDALYSPFRPRHLNPEHYENKYKFWVNAIEQWMRSHRKITVTYNELFMAFSTAGGGRNFACLSEIIEQLLKNQNTMYKDEFMAFPWGGTNISSKLLSWSMKPLKWTVTKLWSYVPIYDISSIVQSTSIGTSIGKQQQQTKNNAQILFPQHIFELVEDLKLKDSENKLQKILSKEVWIQSVGTLLEISSDDSDLLFDYMKKKRLVITDLIKDKEIVKTILISGQANEISDIDKRMYTVLSTKENLESQYEIILKEISQVESLMRQSIKNGNRTTAKHHLKKKKVLEAKASKLLNVIDNLNVLCLQIEDADSNSLVIDAFESGKDALVKILKQKEMNPDRISDIMVEIQDALDDHADIKSSLSQPLVDEGTEDLEAELEQILSDSLPSVPSIPVSSESEKLKHNEGDLALLEELEKLSLSNEGLGNIDMKKHKDGQSSMDDSLPT